jgi:tRNA(fMet)-specific endonuclease VapC
MKYVLDTNAVSELMRANEHVRARLEQLSRKDVAIPQPVLAELAFGVERLPRSKRKDTLRDVLEAIRAEIDVVPWTGEVSDAFARIKTRLERAGQLIEDFDIAIAAHARANNAILVTANAKHMERIDDLEIEDWSVA